RDFEPRTYRAADQRVGTRRSRGRPCSRRHYNRGTRYTRHRSELQAAQAAIIEQHQLDRVTLVIMPDLVGHHAMPATEFTRGQQEIDRGERGPFDLPVEHLDALRGAELLDIVPTLRMRAHAEGVQQLTGAGVHAEARGARFASRRTDRRP